MAEEESSHGMSQNQDLDDSSNNSQPTPHVEGEVVAPEQPFWTNDGTFLALRDTESADAQVLDFLLNEFWIEQTRRAREMRLPKIQGFPLKRIRRIIKSDDDVLENKQRISAEVLELFGMAAELFVSEITLVAHLHRNKEKKILAEDAFARAVSSRPNYDFLLDVIGAPNPPEQKKRDRSLSRANKMVHQINSNKSQQLQNEDEEVVANEHDDHVEYMPQNLDQQMEPAHHEESLQENATILTQDDQDDVEEPHLNPPL